MKTIDKLIKRNGSSNWNSRHITKSTVVNKLKIIKKEHDINLRHIEESCSNEIRTYVESIKDSDKAVLDMAHETEEIKQAFGKLAVDFMKLKYGIPIDITKIDA